MWWDKRPLSTYHKVVRVIAGIMVVNTSAFLVVLLTQVTNTDPVIKWSVTAITALMLVLSILMFRSPSRDP